MPSRKNVEWDFRLPGVKLVDVTTSSLTLRQARPAEPAVEQLAQLDSVKPQAGRARGLTVPAGAAHDPPGPLPRRGGSARHRGPRQRRSGRLRATFGRA